MNLPEGPVTIRFYVNDTVGNVAYDDVLLVLDFIEDQPPDAQPREDQEPLISFGNYYIFFILISLFSLIIFIKAKVKHNKSMAL